MKFFDIMTPKTYKDEGEEKTKWLKVGTLRITEDGKMFIEWNATPDIAFMVFEQKDKPTSKGDSVKDVQRSEK